MTDHGNADLLLFLHLISVREASRLDFELAGDGDAVATDVAVDAGPGTRRADGPVDAARAHSTFALRSGDHFFLQRSASLSFYSFLVQAKSSLKDRYYSILCYRRNTEY